ncbi:MULTISPECIES: YkgJ family cysteine cluster protein [unclassified Pseudomonas]|uniref:YkgJ family cysteine cluster protein n=1 Tax=unclassified Pseudomonas TaxID=196821 RepID=UPI000BC95B78|nr:MULTISPECIES: YkgJ family cysteine cluster protein [unclassified Pseudomonas]PVZ19534.1 putative zinc- or iron-chelating protein [Pseudomonas sp. URIL14HWK12:I12]PVZ22881.1 putative zinc- or iron-chelating protein [Pseudomonas sp. URIL14HWK12:I10]PVZ37489.1 putative zinc- or iron-chelating protein [Pseudomonas sp. URIL14HWK12:I11]SNZ14909.1 Predicted Fe-S-cluster oxidoreductase [Pseudomonas sp. URIL14HWK12:I9]
MPENTAGDIRFTCVGCGSCCRGRFVPLTVAEARLWLERGHPVALLLEAFDESAWPAGAAEFDYHLQRSAPVECASAPLNVIAILAANVIPQCPNLGVDNRCGIYHERPLVCRIYPAEINPFISMTPQAKDCPPESWGQGDLLGSDRELTQLILQSRQADRDDARLKVQWCEALGITVAAWKGNGFAIYRPAVADMLAAFEGLGTGTAARRPWRICVRNAELEQALAARALATEPGEAGNYIFHEL